MSEKYEQVWDGEWSDWRWRGNKHCCCGCGMIHRVDFRVKNGGLQARWTGMPRLTYQARRRAGIKITKTKGNK